jgi:hypothetical protein
MMLNSILEYRLISLWLLVIEPPMHLVCGFFIRVQEQNSEGHIPICRIARVEISYEFFIILRFLSKKMPPLEAWIKAARRGCCVTRSASLSASALIPDFVTVNEAANKSKSFRRRP